jgi:hypothetical protein
MRTIPKDMDGLVSIAKHLTQSNAGKSLFCGRYILNIYIIASNTISYKDVFSVTSCLEIDRLEILSGLYAVKLPPEAATINRCI